MPVCRSTTPSARKHCCRGWSAKARRSAWTPTSRARFFVAPLDAAKRWQREHFDKWRNAKQGAFDKVADLGKELRPQIDDISRAMLTAVAEVRLHLQRRPQLLRDRSSKVLSGVPSAVRDAALGF